MNRIAGLISLLMLICAMQGVPAKADESGGALLITYPDYPINTDTFYGYTEQVGHAGVLLIKKDGLTKYYEFGRYASDQRGRVRRVVIPNVKMQSGRPTPASLAKVLKALSDKSGKKGRVRAAYFINMDFKKMNDHAVMLLSQSTPSQRGFDANRKSYSITSYNCGHFAETVILKGHPKVDQPTIVNPTPNNFVDEYIEEGNAEVTFNPASNEIVIGTGDESDAKE